MMRKTGSLILIGLGVVIGLALLIQLVPYGRDHTNPPVNAEPAWDSPRTRELFARACGDCHSHETAWPWYSSLAPVSWLVAHDVQEGREKFNVSLWSQGQRKAGEAAEQVERGGMPPRIYLVMHPEARLSADERTELILGLRATFGEGEGREDGE